MYNLFSLLFNNYIFCIKFTLTRTIIQNINRAEPPVIFPDKGITLQARNPSSIDLPVLIDKVTGHIHPGISRRSAQDGYNHPTLTFLGE